MKEGTEVVGYDFIMNIEKSRFVKEKSKFPLHVTYEGGISMYSGLLDLAMEMNFVQTVTKGWRNRAFLNTETGELKLKKRNGVSQKQIALNSGVLCLLINHS
ncbi:RecA-like recombination protein [Klebsiella phage CPRSA]|nr:RecA-like recombination protein [Klebsiella phage CPRSA]